MGCRRRSVKVLTGPDKPRTAGPATIECASRGAFTPGRAPSSPLPIPTTDGALYLAAEIVRPEPYRNDATGHFWDVEEPFDE